MNANFSIIGLLYPAVVLAIILLLTKVIYSKPSHVIRIFAQYNRPHKLKTLIQVWFGLMVVVFIGVQALRVPFLYKSIQSMHDPAQVFYSWHGILQVLGMLIMGSCELLVSAGWMMYITYCWIGATRYRIPQIPKLKTEAPFVAVMIPACDEDPESLLRSLNSCTKFRYPNYKVYLVENSRKPELKAQTIAIAEKYAVEILQIKNRGHKSGAVNDAMKFLDPRTKYIAMIDADQRVLPNFLEELVPILENDEKLAFVQTPQMIDNVEATWITRAAAQQDMLSYDTILEAKGALGRATCCGTNLVIRKDALESVGGWDEETVSEDLMTSYLIHRAGWKSLYMRKAYAFGLGPLDLKAYWTQQKRWASGNTTVALKVFKELIHGKVSKRIGIEYFWSGGHYMITIALAVLAISPMLLLIYGRLSGTDSTLTYHQVFPHEWVYLSVCPLYAVFMLFPYLHMRLRGYRIRSLLMVQGLLAITMPIYLSSVLKSFFKISKSWEMMPRTIISKGVSIWKVPQTYLFAVMIFAGSLLTHSVYKSPNTPVIWVALFWVFIYTISYSHYFIFTYEGFKSQKKNLDELIRPSDVAHSMQESEYANNIDAENSEAITQ